MTIVLCILILEGAFAVKTADLLGVVALFGDIRIFWGGRG
jgi:hypothetical protein